MRWIGLSARTNTSALAALPIPGFANSTDRHQRDLHLFREFHIIVVLDHVDPEAAHKAFMEIDEYREIVAACSAWMMPDGNL